jgi:tRNA pseudouridine32 synthase/23S rRNA pseudouridine746 synthase
MYTLIKDNKNFLVINKHPDVNFHKTPENEGLTGIIKSDLGISELYTVHRLDKITSGLLVFAKNKVTANDLSAQFRERLAEKYYLAISDRPPKKKQGTIKGDMNKARGGAWKLSRTMNNPAVTQFFSYSLGSGLRLYILKPLTGKTHQLRVALKSLGSPVLGDPVYYTSVPGKKSPDRGYLHSYALRFILAAKNYSFMDQPDKGIYFSGESFRDRLELYKKPWELNWPRLK